MNNPEVVPLFPEPVCLYRTNTRDILEELKQEDWALVKTSSLVGGKGTYMTRDLYILDKYPDIKEMIMNHFNKFKDEYLGYVHNEFVITTSWGTKTEEGCQSAFHDHKNCMFSGVFYVTGGDDSASVVFKKDDKQSFWCVPNQQNQWNSTTWFLCPEYQQLIFFPSNLQHSIGLQRFPRTRYSIAFNLMPSGILGNDDSHVKLSYEKVKFAADD